MQSSKIKSCDGNKVNLLYEGFVRQKLERERHYEKERISKFPKRRRTLAKGEGGRSLKAVKRKKV